MSRSVDTMRAAAVVLAAGAASRFGGPKLAAMLNGRPVLRHVLDAAVEARLDPIVVVIPPDDRLAAIDLAPAIPIVNGHPEQGLSSSVRLGLRAIEADATRAPVEAALILQGDQPLVRASTIRALIAAAAETPGVPFLVARHAADGSPNPVLARRSTWRLADELVGDRGFGPILATHDELVRSVEVEGTNPDIDTPDDLRRVAGTEGPPSDVS